MSIWNGDASEVRALGAALVAAPAKAVGPMRSVMAAVGEATAEQWASNARATSGAHGVHYPESIDSEMVLSGTSIAVDVGPNAGMPQGGMSFEFGSRNQPPHLDGAKALDEMTPRAEKMIDAAMGHLFP